MKKILSQSALLNCLKSERRKQNKIVFTNGCFDLLHVGHVKVFQESKKAGDILVVGLNSDRSVRSLKGPNRPLVKERDRAELIASLSCVDYVTIFDEQTPHKLLSKICPDVLVKGGDYKTSQIVGREFAKKIKRISLVKGISTSNLIKKIIRVYGG